jgi:hypothetical protein
VVEFSVVITETLSRIVKIEAQTEDDALAIAEGRFDRGEITLNDSDFADVVFSVLTESAE